jgi:molybdopterin converting factor small subunit
MIQVTLKPHATLKAVFGQNDLNISVPEGSTIGEVLDQAFGPFRERLEQRYGLQGTQELLKSCIVLLNGVHDCLETRVKEGDQIDTLDLIPGG